MEDDKVMTEEQISAESAKLQEQMGRLDDLRVTASEARDLLRARALVNVRPFFEVYKSRRNVLLETVRMMAPCYGSSIPELSARLAVYQRQILDDACHFAKAKKEFYFELEDTEGVLTEKDPEFHL